MLSLRPAATICTYESAFSLAITRDMKGEIRGDGYISNGSVKPQKLKVGHLQKPRGKPLGKTLGKPVYQEETQRRRGGGN